MATKLSTLKIPQLASDLEALDKLAPVIHVKGRLAIVSVLAATPQEAGLTFTELRDVLRLTDGNLAAHLRALDAAGFVRLSKRSGTGRSVTAITLSAAGRTAFSRYLDGLEHIVKRHR